MCTKTLLRHRGGKKLTKNRNLFTSCNVLLVGHMLQLFRCGERDSISKLAGLLPGPPVEENASFCLSVGTTHSHTETKHAHNNSPNLSQLYREKITALMSVVHTCNWCPEPPIIQTKHWKLLMDCQRSVENKIIMLYLYASKEGGKVVHWKRKGEEQKACWYSMDSAFSAVRPLLNNLYFYGNWDADVLMWKRLLWKVHKQELK